MGLQVRGRKSHRWLFAYGREPFAIRPRAGPRSGRDGPPPQLRLSPNLILGYFAPRSTLFTFSPDQSSGLVVEARGWGSELGAREPGPRTSGSNQSDELGRSTDLWLTPVGPVWGLREKSLKKTLRGIDKA